MKVIEKIITILSGILLVAMFVLCIMQVTCRYVLNISATFTEEFARMSYIWLVFLMLPVLESHDEQMKVSYFLGKFPEKIRVVLYWVISLVSSAFLVLMAVGSFKLMTTPTTVTFASTVWLKLNYQYIPVFIGSVLGILFMLRRAFHAKEALQEESKEYEI